MQVILINKKKWLLNHYIGGDKNRISQHAMMGTRDCFKLELISSSATIPRGTFFVHPNGTIKYTRNVIPYEDNIGHKGYACISTRVGSLLVIPKNSQETVIQRKVEAGKYWDVETGSDATFEIVENILDLPPQSIIKHPSFIKFTCCFPSYLTNTGYMLNLHRYVLHSISSVSWDPEEYLTLAAILHRAQDRDNFSTIIRNKFLESIGIRESWFHQGKRLLYSRWRGDNSGYYSNEAIDKYCEQIYPLHNLYAVDLGDYQLPPRLEDADIVKKIPEAIIHDLRRSQQSSWMISPGYCWNNHRFASVTAGLGIFAVAIAMQKLRRISSIEFRTSQKD
jgi:hypothetical protein